MKFMKWGKDGGPQSGVRGFWLVEIKWLFSIALLRFDRDNREELHSHAFNALTWWLSGEAKEQLIDGTVRLWTPSLIPKYTPRSCFHKVFPQRTTWALSLRGPWSNRWFEYNERTKKLSTLRNGRVKTSVHHINNMESLNVHLETR